MPAGADTSDPRLTVHRFQVERGYWSDEMLGFCQTFEYDVLVIHSTNPHLLELAEPAHAAGREVVFCPQTPTEHTIAQLLANVDRMIVLLPSWAEHFSGRHKFGGAIKVLPRLVDVGWFERRATKDSGPRRLLYVGRFAPGKRVRAVIEAFAELRATGEAHTLYLVGAPDDVQRDMPPIEDAIRRARATGSVTASRADTIEECGTAYGHGDVLVSASTSETFCQVFLEALASGLAVVTTAKGGCREWAWPFVTFVDRPEQLADGVRVARALGGAEYDEFVREFSWQARRGEWEGAIRG